MRSFAEFTYVKYIEQGLVYNSCFSINISMAILKNNTNLDILSALCVFPLILFSETVSLHRLLFIDDYTRRFHQVVCVQWMVITIVGNTQHKYLLSYIFHYSLFPERNASVCHEEFPVAWILLLTFLLCSSVFNIFCNLVVDSEELVKFMFDFVSWQE